MTNTKLGLANMLVTAQNPAITATAHNDIGDVSPYVIANVFHYDRYSWWRTPDLALGNFIMDFNMGGVPPVDAAGMFCLEMLYGGLSGVDVYTQTTAYSFGGTWTSQGTLSGSKKDEMITFGLVGACHSIRFTFNVSVNPTSFRLGNFFAGQLSDLGGVYTRGGTREQFHNRIERRLPSGVPSIVTLGDPGAIFSFPWAATSAAQRAIFEDMFSKQLVPYPLALLDEKGNAHQGILRDGKMRDALVMGTTYDMDFEIEKLP